MFSSSDPVLSEQLAELQERNQALEQSLEDKDVELTVQRELLAEREEQISVLSEKLSLLLAKRYKHSSEKLEALQGSLFDEAELQSEIDKTLADLAAKGVKLDAGEDSDDPDSPPAHPHSKRARAAAAPTGTPRRCALPAHLRRVELDVDVSPEDKQMMGDEWIQIGWETSEQLAVVEREAYVKVLRRAKYVRRSASADPVTQPSAIKVAPTVPVILPKAIADATLLAKIITGKFVDQKSFYREMKALERDGVDIGYSTVCSYPIQLAQRLEPLKALLYEYAMSGPLVQLDETTLQVMGEPDREDRTKSYIWALRGGPTESPVVLFHYDARRNYEALCQWLEPALERFNGVIVTDEHKPYQKLADADNGIVARGGCWSHCRRKYADAVKGRRHTSDAHAMLKHIARLYKLEDKCASLRGAEKARRRQKLLTAQLGIIHEAAKAMSGKYISDGLMHKAVGYTLNNWSSLTAFLEHPDLPIDNNRMENSIRPFTVGRRNWLFSGSPRAADASAFMYSLIESAKANGWEPRAYLNALFERYPHAGTEEERRLLLPMFLTKT